MQLILDDPTIGIVKMSVVEESHSPDVVTKLCTENNIDSKNNSNISKTGGNGDATEGEAKGNNVTKANIKETSENLETNTLVLEITVKESNSGASSERNEGHKPNCIFDDAETAADVANETTNKKTIASGSKETREKAVTDHNKEERPSSSNGNDSNNDKIAKTSQDFVMDEIKAVQDTEIETVKNKMEDSVEEEVKVLDNIENNTETDTPVIKMAASVDDSLEMNENNDVSYVDHVKSNETDSSTKEVQETERIDNKLDDSVVMENEANLSLNEKANKQVDADLTDAKIAKTIAPETSIDCIEVNETPVAEMDETAEIPVSEIAETLVTPSEDTIRPENVTKTVDSQKVDELSTDAVNEDVFMNEEADSNQTDTVEEKVEKAIASLENDSYMETDVVENKDTETAKCAEIKDSEIREIILSQTADETIVNDREPSQMEVEDNTKAIKDITDPTDSEKLTESKNDITESVPQTNTNKQLANEDNVIEIMDNEPEKAKNGSTEAKTETTAITKDKNINKFTVNNDNIEIIDEDDIKIVEEKTEEASPEKQVAEKPPVIKLSNTLNILSDDEDEEPPLISKSPAPTANETKEPVKTDDKENSDKCINIDDDDDIMLIEDTKEKNDAIEENAKVDGEKKSSAIVIEVPPDKPIFSDPNIMDVEAAPEINEKETKQDEVVKKEEPKPLLPLDFLKSAKKNLADMTRDELEEFCILKLVESIVDRSSLNDIKTKMKTMESTIEEYKKKAGLLNKQNRDLQVVLKSVQEEMKKRPASAITPLKITRSVGMQVLMTDKIKRKTVPLAPAPTRPVTTPIKNVGAQKQKPANAAPQIPVPRLVPASPAKTPVNTPIAPKPPTPNGMKMTTPPTKPVEKRPVTRQSSMTVDLTDDEPPAKAAKTMPVPPVRLIPSSSLLAPRMMHPTANANANNPNPRKVCIPISAQKNVRPVFKTVPAAPGPRPRAILSRMPQSTAVRLPKNMAISRHPAPLPELLKQYQSPTWKALPPAPDLKLSKVENGIVISWKIEGYHEDSYEKIASYQLYAYQETSVPPSTTLWKKIGDVKALPLPMACTLTQFIAGYKYYFAVRAVDVKSRVGPFSLPGSILLLNKM